MTKKQLRALTERNVYAIAAAAEKTAETIAIRFEDIDNTMVTRADALRDMIRLWSKDIREYMNDVIKEDDFWTGI